MMGSREAVKRMLRHCCGETTGLLLKKPKRAQEKDIICILYMDGVC